MMNRQYHTRYIQPISKTIFTPICCFFVVILVVLFLTSSSFAKDKRTYGPIQEGQSLWTIAEETRPNRDTSIEQIVYAFYHLNPNAFQSNNMNLLKIGSYIIVPDTDIIKKTNSKKAKQSLSKHAHALALLRADAKQLKKSKQKTKKYQLQIKKIQRNLAKYRYKSKRWNSTYRKLVKAKRRYAKSKRKSRELQKLLLEKSTLIATSGIKKNQAPKADHVVIEKLSQIQGQLTQLQEANQILIDKSKSIEVLTQRMKVLEDELGATDQLVVQLKNTVESIRDDIKEQNKTTEVLKKTLKN